MPLQDPPSPRMSVYTEKSQPAQNVANTASMHKKGRILPPMHSRKARPKARIECTEKTMRPAGRIITYMPFYSKYWSYFTRTTCSVDATLTSARWEKELKVESEKLKLKKCREATPQFYTLHSTLYTLLASVFRTMTPRRVGEFKVESEKFTLYILHFTLFTLVPPPRRMTLLYQKSARSGQADRRVRHPRKFWSLVRAHARAEYGIICGL